jgi:hypothetical protein
VAPAAEHMSGANERFVTRGRLCLASGGTDSLAMLSSAQAAAPSERSHRGATRRDCGLSWSPSQPARPAALALAAIWESALNSTDGDLSFSPEMMKKVRPWLRSGPSLLLAAQCC